MKTHIARTAGVVVAVLALDYLLLVGIGLFLTKVLGKGSALVESEDELNKSLADGRTPRMDDVTYLLSGLGNTGAIIGALVVVAIALYFATKKWGPSIFLVLAVSGQALVFLLVTADDQPAATGREAARLVAADLELPERPHRRGDRAVRRQRAAGRSGTSGSPG